ncbi:DUF899 family protein [Umezawaea tangerina]|uniref:Putative dithiol-disulfide oxidoreductase (DUF899 family) n=1 Tax=Umezawaea tangerina TaxID=84725 RepID=A0A2T0TG51_9PSEU|nr:DUF899 family protein [Umezawaea tangerina]PRY44608.1 putative dithiol-disulfide oxidoreductase (DUF899 family) [Umezawaea tangerina]
MGERGFTTGFTADRGPREVFDAVLDVRGWWSEDVEGRTAEVGDEFTCRAGEPHRRRIRVTEVVPDRRVVWSVLDDHVGSTEDRTGWTGTTIAFDIAERDGRTEVRFAHEGLPAEHECHGTCCAAWGFHIGTSLRELVETGVGRPDEVDRRPAGEGVPQVVGEREWQEARDELLRAEKEATALLDALAARRRRLPMVPVATDYRFDTPDGVRSLPDLFDGRAQLVVYQFMDNGPDHYCPGCTWFTDNIPSTAPALLAEQGITWMTVTNMPLAQAEEYKARKGWTLPFASSRGTTFADDCGAGDGFRLTMFLRDGDRVHRTYATTGRGIDRLAFVTSLLDLSVFGRREEWEDSPAGWPRQPTARHPNTMTADGRALSFGRFR